MATLGAGFFAALSVISIPGLQNGSKLRLPQATFIGAVTLVTFYFVMSMLNPNWLKGFPTEAEWFQHTLTVTTVMLLLCAAWRYYQSYQFARLPGQLAVTVGLVFLAEAQLSLDFGAFPQYSWWLYHALFLAAFVTVLIGWSWEVIRSKDGRAIAEGIFMRDALSQMNRGRPTNLVALTSHRPYRPAMTLVQARAELERVAGTQLDPGLVQVIVKLIDNAALAAHAGHTETKDHDHTLRTA